MNIKLLVLASLGLVASGCGRSEDANSTSSEAQQAPPPAATTSASATAPASTTNEVASYPTQMVQGGTVKLAQPVKVHQAADPDSTMLTRLGTGTVVEKKASYGDWMLVNWPSGVGETSPGWVQASLLVPVITDAGIPEAGPPPIPDAGPLNDAGAAKTIPRPSTTAGASDRSAPSPPPNTTTKRPTFKVTPK